jgi:hypothetical protein
VADPGSTDSSWSTYESIRRVACEGRRSWISIRLRPDYVTGGRRDPLATSRSRIGDHLLSRLTLANHHRAGRHRAETRLTWAITVRGSVNGIHRALRGSPVIGGAKTNIFAEPLM